MPHTQNPLDEYRDRSVDPMARVFTEYGRDDVGLFVLGLVASLFGQLVGLVPPLVLGVAIDATFRSNGATTPYRLPLVPDASLPTGQSAQLWFSAELILAAYVLSVAFTWLQGVSLSLFSNRIQHDLRIDAYASMQRLDMAFFDDKQTGQVMAVLSNDVRNLRDFLSDTLSGAVQLIVTVLGIAGVLVWMNAKLALITLVAVPLLVAFTVSFMRTVRPLYAALRASVGELNTRLENNLSGIEVIKTSNTETYEERRVTDASWDYYLRNWAVVKLQYFYQPGMELLAGVSFAATFVVGGLWLITGTGALQVGEFVTFLFMTQRFISPLAGAGRIVNSYENARASGERIFGLSDLPVVVDDEPDAVPLEHPAGRVEYDAVDFAYRDGRPVLSDVSFVAEPGETVALVGPTGAGKSTAAKLLMRLYDVSDGAVRIDGHDVRNVTLDSLRSAVGYVSQDVYLFDGTVRENLVYGAFDATDEEVVAAATAAEAHSFVERLPDGYDTRIGERGVKLSGGQRQRLSIARAMLQDPSILVLDEATSAVDTETELLIQRALARLTDDRTTFVIAHRLSTIRDADRILVIDDGRIVERGTHDELVAEDGLYAALWYVQAGELDRADPRMLDRLAKRAVDGDGVVEPDQS